MKKAAIICIPIIEIIVGIYLMSYDKIYYSLATYIISILTIILIIIFGNLSLDTKNILQSLILLPILEVINFSTPQFFTIIYLRYIWTGVIMFMPLYLIMNNLLSKDSKILSKDSKINYGIIIVLIATISILAIQYVDIISGAYVISVETLSIGEKFATIFLIISFLISVFISDTKYWNRYNSNILDICSDTMLIVFLLTIANNILIILSP